MYYVLMYVIYIKLNIKYIIEYINLNNFSVIIQLQYYKLKQVKKNTIFRILSYKNKSMFKNYGIYITVKFFSSFLFSLNFFWNYLITVLCIRFDMSLSFSYHSGKYNVLTTSHIFLKGLFKIHPIVMEKFMLNLNHYFMYSL